MSQRAQFVTTTTRLMAADDKIILLLGDIGTHGFRGCFEQWPTRCYNIGVCEQTMVGIAAGLAKEGFYPIVHSIASFLLRRPYEFILVDFGFQELAGCFVGVGASGEYGALGKTHSCPEDEWLVDKIPGMNFVDTTIGGDTPDGPLYPVDWALPLACKERRLTYIRLGP